MAGDGHTPPDGKKGLFDNAWAVNGFIYLLIAACIAVFVFDFFYEKHPYFEVEGAVPAFQGLWGFGSFVFIVAVGVVLRKIVMRDEDYYDR